MKASIRLLVLCFLILVSGCHKKSTPQNHEAGILSLEKSSAANLSEKQREAYLDEAWKHFSKSTNDSLNRALLFKTALGYYELGTYDKYFESAKKAYGFSVAAKDSANIAKGLYYIADYYEAKTRPDSALAYYKKSNTVYQSINDTLNSGKTTLYKAGILYDVGSFDESEIEAVRALKLLDKTGETRLVYEAHVLIALSLKEVNNYKQALQYFGQALEQLQKLESENYPPAKILNSRASCNNNIGGVYEKMENYPKAIQYYKTALGTPNIDQTKPSLYSMLLSNLAYSKMKSGDTIGVRNLLFKSLKIRDSLDLEAGIVSGTIRIGEYYLIKKDTATALHYLKQGYEKATAINSNYDIIHSLKLLTENDAENKTYYANLFIKVGDSLKTAERATRNTFTRIAYETDQIEEKNEILSRRNAYMTIAILLLAFVIVIVFIVFRLRAKNTQLVFLKDQQEANEKIYQLMLNQQSQSENARKEERYRIATELHDGIVNSIFTTRFNLMQLAPEQADMKQKLVAELENIETDIRKISHQLTQNTLFDDKDFAEIITALVHSQQNAFRTRFDVTIDKYIDWKAVSGENKIHVYRILQETLQNTNKHSKAEKCLIMIMKSGAKITIRISDNGIGFDQKKLKYGLGLKNMNERIKALDGTLKVTSKKDGGTTIEVVF